MKSIKIDAACLAPACLTLLLGGCGGGDNSKTLAGIHVNNASLYFYNQLTQFGSSTSTNLDVNLLVGATSTALQTSVPYSTTYDAGATSLSLNGTTADVQFSLQRSSDGLILGTNSLTLTDGAKYTLVALGDLGNTAPQVRAFRQNYSLVSGGAVRIRFIDALSQLPNTASLEVDVDGTPLASGLEYGYASGYSILSNTSPTLTFNILQAGTSLAKVDCSVQNGESYDAIIAYTNPSASNIGIFCHKLSP